MTEDSNSQNTRLALTTSTAESKYDRVSDMR